MTTRTVFVSVVCVVQNAEAYLEDRLRALASVLAQNFRYYEVLLIDDASSDKTSGIALRLLRSEKNIQYCALSSRVSEHIALTAGLDRAIGDFVVTMDLAVDPPSAIPELVDLALTGSEIVYALPRARLRGKRAYDRLAKAYLKWVARFNDINLPEAMSTLRVFSRTVLTYMLSSANYHRIVTLAPALSGYAFTTYEYDRMPPPQGERRRVNANVLLRSLDLTFSTSARPLRLVTIASLGLSVISVIYAIYVVIARLLMENIAPGWATLSLQTALSFFIVSVVLAVLCEYLLQVLEITRRWPVYHVARESHSSVMEQRKELNVENTAARAGGEVRF
jgi:hypothetical protein